MENYIELQISAYSVEEAIEKAIKTKESFVYSANIVDSTEFFQRYQFKNFIQLRLEKMNLYDIEVVCIKLPTVDKRKRKLFTFQNNVAKGLTYFSTVWQVLIKDHLSKYNTNIVIAEEKTKPEAIYKAIEFVKEEKKSVIVRKIKIPVNNIVSAELVYNKIKEDTGIYVFYKKIPNE